jgi:NAD-dependent dihydropyrimidine dehydrogenase PreA subunit
MIELLSASRCTGCNLCVRACPAHVFAPRDGDIPVIAHQEDCQTCFMCELYCPADAIYVSPHAERSSEVDEAELSRRGVLGSFARNMGWKRGKPAGADTDPTFRFRALTRE